MSVRSLHIPRCSLRRKQSQGTSCAQQSLDDELEHIATSSADHSITGSAQVITPSAPQPVLFGPFGFRLPATAAKLLARLKRPGLLWTSALFATHAAVGAASVALASQLISSGGGPPTAGEALRPPISHDHHGMY